MPGLVMKYFNLKPKSKYLDDRYASASRAGMRAFADAIERENLELAQDLRKWAAREVVAAAKMPSLDELLKPK